MCKKCLNNWMNASILNLMLGVAETMLKEKLTHWKYLKIMLLNFAGDMQDIYYHIFLKPLFNKLLKNNCNDFTTHIRTKDVLNFI